MSTAAKAVRMQLHISAIVVWTLVDRLLTIMRKTVFYSGISRSLLSFRYHIKIEKKTYTFSRHDGLDLSWKVMALFMHSLGSPSADTPTGGHFWELTVDLDLNEKNVWEKEITSWISFRISKARGHSDKLSKEPRKWYLILGVLWACCTESDLHLRSAVGCEWSSTRGLLQMRSGAASSLQSVASGCGECTRAGCFSCCFFKRTYQHGISAHARVCGKQHLFTRDYLMNMCTAHLSCVQTYQA